MNHLKSIGAGLVIIIAMSACVMGGVPFQLIENEDGTTTNYQHEADCAIGDGMQMGPAADLESFGSNLSSGDCYDKICRIEAYRLSQFCRLKDGNVDPNDLEIGFTIGSLSSVVESWNNSMAGS